MKNPDIDLIGKTKEEAESVLAEEGTRFRYDWIDDVSQINDCQFDIERVNMTLRDNRVIATSRG